MHQLSNYHTAIAVPPLFVPVLMLFIFGTNAHKKVRPPRAVAAAQAAFKQAIYARNIPGKSSSENASRSLDAPIAITLAGSIVGANSGSFFNRTFVNMLWARETEIAPETS